ncbi:MAG: hypothetical protein MUO72_15035 [Bacteroidales bacterium]|nr:hypothetical protein [Bacteroidales bacterium]
MKKISLAILTVFLTTIMSGQEFKISIAPTINNALYFQSVDGGHGHISRPGLSTSVGYYMLQDKKISFCLGLSYQFSQVKVDPFIDPLNDPLPFTESLNILSFNIGAIYNLKRDFYLTLDPTVDLQLNIEPRLWIHNIIPLQDENLPLRLTVAGLNLGLIF